MGFFQWLFGKKKKITETENWEEIVYERDKVNLYDDAERERYLTECMEQIREASWEVN